MTAPCLPETHAALDPVLRDALAWLLDQSRENARPEAARRNLPELQRAHPSLDIDLVWEAEDYSGVVHYDLLLRVPNQGTVSLSYCPERAVPWPLRNAYRAPDSWVLRVNGRVIDSQTAMTSLDVIWRRTDLVKSLIDFGIVDEAITRRGISSSSTELAQAVQDFRRKNNLVTADDDQRFLTLHGLTHRALERRLEAELQQDKLVNQVTSHLTEEDFSVRLASYDTARVARFRVPTEAEAQALATQIRNGQLDFLEAAQSRFLAGSPAGTTFAILRRGTLTPEQSTLIFSAAPGDIVIVPIDGAFEILRIFRIDPAQLTPETRARIRRAAFDAWLTAQRNAAQIQWFWGDPELLPNQNTGWTA